MASALRIDTRLLDLHDCGFGLTVSSGDEQTVFFFNEQGLLGDGCTWHGVVDALVRSQIPGKLRRKLAFTSEADSLLIYSKDQALLKRIEALIQDAAQSEEAILRAIEKANPGLLE